MAVLAKGLNVPFIVEGEEATKILNKKPSPKEVEEGKKIAQDFAKGLTVRLK